jgi:hypothetical protein
MTNVSVSPLALDRWLWLLKSTRDGKTKMRFLGVVVLCVALGGCLTAQERPPQTSSNMSPQQQGFYDFFVSQGMDKDAAIIAALNPSIRQLYFDDKNCQSYGAKPGSDAYVACRTQLEVSHTAASR